MKKEIVSPLSQKTFEKSYGKNPLLKTGGVERLFGETIASMDKFAIGPYMWIIAKLSDLRVYKSGGMVEMLTGMSAEEFTALPGGASELTIPEDIEPTFGFLFHSMEYRKSFSWERRNQIFASYHFRLTYPVHGRWVVLKTIEESPEIDGEPQYILSMLMDVSHIKNAGTPMMTIYDAHTTQSKIFVSGGLKEEINIDVPLLSSRELEVLSYVARGYSSKMTAAELKISPKTVENHRRNVLQKIHCKSSTEAISFAMRHGLL